MPTNPNLPPPGQSSPGQHLIGQASFDDLSTPLSDTTFVVVDLETTGGSAKDCHITEIGAVKSRGGVVQGEFQTLVDPGITIPPFIASLTGITNATLAGAPSLAAALPMFLDFAAGSVLVAHNAGFDISFLKAGCSRLDLPWPGHRVVDTARLARVLLHRDEVPNNKLATLARFFRAETTPTHRALADAQATVDVLHGLLERAGGFGVHHLEDLAEIANSVTPEQRQKRTLADDLPELPGVYVFRDRQQQPLYVGKSVNIRNRVRSYFTASEKRRRMTEMVRIAESISAIPCATDLEAQIREIRLIAECKPPYNRRSRSPEKAKYLKLTHEPFPRFSVVAKAPQSQESEAIYLGPFSSKRTAEAAREAATAAFPLRSCTTRLTRKTLASDCAAAELGSCLAPCNQPEVWPSYDALVSATRTAVLGDISDLYATVEAEMSRAAGAEQFEQAAARREQLRTLLSGIHNAHTYRTLGQNELLVAARPAGRHWELHVLKYGRLAGAAHLDPRKDVQSQVDAAIDASAAVAPPTEAPTSALSEETALIIKWLYSDGVRLARVTGVIAEPVNSAARYLAQLPRPQTDPYRTRDSGQTARAGQQLRARSRIPVS